MPAAVAVVTDSTACLPAELGRALLVRVVPLRLIAGPADIDDGDPGMAAVIEQAAARGERLTTARPAPERFELAYRQAAADGAVAIVSVHLSALLSGTIGSAELAAAGCPLPVEVVDSRTVGMGLGLAVLAAAAAAAAGQPLADVAAAARRYAGQTRSFFALDSAQALMAGGRMAQDQASRAAAVSGAAPSDAAPSDAAPSDAAPADPGLPPLIARPLLEIGAGRVRLLERVRTRAAAAGRLVELAAEAARSVAAAETAGAGSAGSVAAAETAGAGSAGSVAAAETAGACAAGAGAAGAGAAGAGGGVDVAVQYTGPPDRADDLASRLMAALPRIGSVYLTQASGAIRAHAGPGMLGVTIGPRAAGS